MTMAQSHTLGGMTRVGRLIHLLRVRIGIANGVRMIHLGTIITATTNRFTILPLGATSTGILGMTMSRQRCITQSPFKVRMMATSIIGLAIPTGENLLGSYTIT